MLAVCFILFNCFYYCSQHISEVHLCVFRYFTDTGTIVRVQSGSEVTMKELGKTTDIKPHTHTHTHARTHTYTVTISASCFKQRGLSQSRSQRISETNLFFTTPWFFNSQSIVRPENHAYGLRVDVFYCFVFILPVQYIHILQDCLINKVFFCIQKYEYSALLHAPLQVTCSGVFSEAAIQNIQS